ncbi:MAG: hypothetical protein WCS94_21460 [Verrucomicrobiota bacterium]
MIDRLPDLAFQLLRMTSKRNSGVTGRLVQPVEIVISRISRPKRMGFSAFIYTMVSCRLEFDGKAKFICRIQVRGIQYGRFMKWRGLKSGGVVTSGKFFALAGLHFGRCWSSGTFAFLS